MNAASDYEKFSEMIGALAVTFDREINAAFLTGYWIALRDLDLSSFTNAVSLALKACDRLPVPAKLRELASGGREEDRAIAAWSDVQRSAAVSYMADLDFQDRTINAVVRHLGGRSSFFARLGSGVEEEKWLRIEFLKAYQSLGRCELSGEACAMLIGEADHESVAGRGGRVRIARIGCDPARARLSAPSDKLKSDIEGSWKPSGLLELRSAQ